MCVQRGTVGEFRELRVKGTQSKIRKDLRYLAEEMDFVVKTVGHCEQGSFQMIRFSNGLALGDHL